MVVRADSEANGICVFSHEALSRTIPACYHIVTVRRKGGGRGGVVVVSWRIVTTRVANRDNAQQTIRAHARSLQLLALLS